ncbi:MAG: sulfatase [Gemmatimonadota bacterium]
MTQPQTYDDVNRAGFVLLMGAVIGLGTGLGEVLLFAAQTTILRRFVFVGRDIVWMAPLAELIVFLGVAVLLALYRAVWKRNVFVPATLVFGFMAFLALLLMYTPLHQGAAILLAIGMAVQSSRMIRKHPAGFATFIRRSGWILATLTIFLGAGTTAARRLNERRAVAALPPARGAAPNILLIILDTARSMDLSSYGYNRPTTPFLEQLAHASVQFDYAFSNAPWTLPSHASLFTGRFPHELSAGWLNPLDDKFPTLAEALAAEGYRTAGFVGNTLYCDTEKGLNRGFEHWEDYAVNRGELFRSSVLIREITGRKWAREPFNSYQLLGRKSAADVNREFLHWLDDADGRPFFTFLNYFDAHAPYLPDSADARRFATPGLSNVYEGWTRYRGKPKDDSLPGDWVQDNRDRYDAMLYSMDTEIGRLMGELKRRGILENTIVVITADHGEQFGEHAIMGHGNSLYLPLLHVPLFIRYPHSVPAGQHVTSPASLRDLSATLLDLAEAGNTRGIPGRSLARFWRRDTTYAASTDTLLMEVDYNPRLPKGAPIDRGSMRAVVLDTLHYIANGDHSEELYNYSADPIERNNMAGTPAGASDVTRHRGALKAIIPSAAGTP